MSPTKADQKQESSASLEKRFRAAVAYIRSNPPGATPSAALRLRFYAHYKQATEGRCKGKKPAMYKVEARAKHNAWEALGNMSTRDAQLAYVDLVQEFCRSANTPASLRVLKSLMPSSDDAPSPSALTPTTASGVLSRPTTASASSSSSSSSSSSPSSSSSSSSSPVQVYGNMLSQPTRAVLWLCHLARIPVQFHSIDLAKREHLKPDFLALNPHHQVPVMDDNGFVVFESHAILRYLVAKYAGEATSFYPTELHQRTRCDQYLDWHHTNTRQACKMAVFNRVLAKRFGIAKTEKELEESDAAVLRLLDTLERTWLAEQPFVAGDHPTLGDLLALCEIDQLMMTPHLMKAVESKPRLNAWITGMRALPHYAQVTEVLRRLAPILAAKL